MSNAVRIGLVGEGITDFVVLKAVIQSILQDRAFELKLLQPEESVAFTGGGSAGPLGGGWKGVYKWCRQAAERGAGRLRSDPLFINYDLLLLHLDADVASEDPANDAIRPIPELAGYLPCEEACPLPDATTNRLRLVLLSWVGETDTPPRTILCTPSKSIETWVISACFPADKEVVKQHWECYPTPEVRLGQQKKSDRFSKRQTDYERAQPTLQTNWPAVAARLSEAGRFQNEFASAVETLAL